jgi:hypothetical protein
VQVTVNGYRDHCRDSDTSEPQAALHCRSLMTLLITAAAIAEALLQRLLWGRQHRAQSAAANQTQLLGALVMRHRDITACGPRAKLSLQKRTEQCNTRTTPAIRIK